MLEMIETHRNTSYAEKLMKQIYDLRKEVYTSLGWIMNSKGKNELVKDEFDKIPYTTHFALLENDKVIGSHRMIKYSKEFKLPFLNDGISLSIFKENKLHSTSEATRLVIRQDRKYPGAALELLFNTLNYELMRNSDLIYSIGNPDYMGFFKYVGCVPVNDDINIVLNKNGNNRVVRKGTPLVIKKSTLNYGIDFSKYTLKKFVVIKMSDKKRSMDWKYFWNQFSMEGYDDVTLLPENKRMLHTIAKMVGKNKKVLDAGCGSGNLIVKLVHNNHVTGIDLSSNMLKLAAEKTKERNNVVLNEGDVTALPYNKETFDVVSSINVLFNLDNPEKAIKEMQRVLKKNGTLIISTPSKDANITKEFLNRVIKDSEKDNVDRTKIGKLIEFNKVLFSEGGIKFRPSDSQLYRLLHSNGFSIVKKEKIYYGNNLLIQAKKL